MIKKKRGNEKTITEVALRNLGVSSKEKINDWFRRSYAGNYKIHGIDKMLEILDAHKWDSVVIVGDYDVDGTTAAAQCKLVLEHLGYPVSIRIPKRFSEGFGLSPKIIDEIPDGDTLIITVDNGIASIDAIRAAKDRGFTVIVTDHHQPVVENGKVILPNADLIINPNAIPGQADFCGYCGSGLAYKFLTALINQKLSTAHNPENLKKLRAIIEPLAMMGTICDVMELREENYVIARNGLAKLEKRIATAGVLALHDELWLSHPTASNIGFRSGPCINANGRLFDDGAAKSVALLSEMNYRNGVALAKEAVENNNQRKRLVEDGMQMAQQYIKANGFENDLPMIVCLKNLHDGIIGILAGRLREYYGTVAIAFSDDGSGTLKGSGRSIDTINLKAMLDDLQDLFVKYGGHEGAAGITIEKDKVREFRERSQKYAESHGFEHEALDVLEWDCEITEPEVPAARKEAAAFEPFGHGNPAPVFKITGFKLIPDKGKLKNPLGNSAIKMSSEHSQAIAFGDDLVGRLTASKAASLTLYGTITTYYFKGEEIPQIEIIDFDEETATQVETPLMKALRQRAAENRR